MEQPNIPGYEILDKISDGAMGVVYKARQRSLDRLVAIKVLHPHLHSDPIAVAQFRLEANSVATLKHPNILQIYEAGQADGQMYFVMEYVSAYSVADWLSRKGVLTESDALTIADCVARALQYAWEKAGLIHCDLKPGNILVDEDGTIKVADFSGISRSNLSQEAQLLREVTIGTPNYMAPEQVRGLADIDCRVDIYALGAVLYHLVTGHIPFENCSDEEAMRQQLEGTLPDPSQINPRISPAMVMLIEKMLVKDRDQRTPTWPAVLADIERVRAGFPPLPPLPYPGASTLQRRVSAIAAEPTAAHKPRPAFAPPAPPPAPLPSTLPKRSSRLGLVLALIALALLGADIYLLFLWPGSPLRRRAAPREETTSPEPLRPTPTARATGAPPPATTSPVVHPKPPKPVVAKPEPPSPPPPPSFTSQPAVVETPVPTNQVETSKPTLGWETMQDFLKLMQSAMTESARRNYIGASTVVQSWLGTHSDHPMADRVRTEAERFASLVELVQVLGQNTRALWGRSIQYTPGVTGDVLAVRENRILLSRRFGEGVAEVEVELARLSPSDWLDLLRAADESRFPVLAARFLLGELNFAAAETQIAAARRAGMPTDDLERWLADWRSTAMNIRANRAVDDMLAKVASGELAAAGESYRAAVTSYADTDVFRWGRVEDLERIRAAVASVFHTSELPPLTNTTATPRTVATATTSAPTAQPAIAEPDISDIEIVTPAALIGRMRELDGRVVRLRFRYRSSISEVNPGVYATELGMDGYSVRVEFPQEGYRWIRNSVSTAAALDPSLKVAYGVIDARRQVVRLLGRTMKRRIGRPDEFAW